MRRILFIFFIIFSAPSYSFFHSEVDKAIKAIDRAIENLSLMNSDWQKIVNDLRKELPQEIRSTINMEVDQVVQRGVSAAGSQVQCVIDHNKQDVINGLANIKRKLLNQQLVTETPRICLTSPSSISKKDVPKRVDEISFYGFNLNKNVIHLSIEDNEGNIREIPNDKISQPAHYQLMLNLSGGNGVQLKDIDKRIIFSHPNQKYDIAIHQEKPPETIKFWESSFFGGSGGAPFVDARPSTDKLKVVRVWHGATIDAIEIVQGGQTGIRHGGHGGILYEFALGESERIIGVNYRAGAFLDGLQFITNERTSDWLGGQGGIPGNIKIPDGYEMVGFKGRSGNLIDALSLVARSVAAR